MHRDEGRLRAANRDADRPFARRLRACAAGVLLAVVAALAQGCGGDAFVQVAYECTRFAAPDGSDSAPGSEEQPFATPQRLVDALEPGDVGCLREGTYEQAVDISRGGLEEAPVVLTSAPGERAQLRGRLQVEPGADHVTVSRLDLVGDETGVSPAVFASHATFEYNDVTNDNAEICFNLGHQDAGRADFFTLRSNRIHHCGTLPAENRDHGVYVNQATGGRILNNVIYANADRGVQLYPNAMDTVIRGNVIDGNGQGVLFGSEGPNNATVREAPPSSGNLVERNVITNSGIRGNVEVNWAGGVGEDNVVRRNCLHNAADGALEAESASAPGVRLSGNLIAPPRYADRADGDFTPDSESECLAVVGKGALERTPLSPGDLAG